MMLLVLWMSQSTFLKERKLNKMKIVNVASEANPLVKSGGLGDVVYSLSRELAKS